MIRRRILAALLIGLIAIGSPFFWQAAQATPVEPVSLAINLAVGAVGLVALHRRWRRKERGRMTPEKMQDTFS